MNNILKVLEKHQTKLIRIESLLSARKEVLNIDEVCTLTGLSKSTIYKLTHTCTIPHFKQAKHLYFNREEVLQWLQTNRVKTVQEIEKDATSAIMRGGDHE